MYNIVLLRKNDKAAKWQMCEFMFNGDCHCDSGMRGKHLAQSSVFRGVKSTDITLKTNGVDTIFTEKWQVNFTINYKVTHWNKNNILVKCTPIVFIYNFKNIYIFKVYVKIKSNILIKILSKSVIVIFSLRNHKFHK